MPRKITPKIREVLEKAWLKGSITLSGVCPSCFDRMGGFNHGVCTKCKKGCGCSFNATSSSDFCDFHRGDV